MDEFSGVVADLERWKRSEVLFPSFPLHSFSLLSPPSLLSPILPSPPLSGGNNFNDLPENQLTIDFAFLCKPAWGNATVSPFPLVLISFGGMAFPTKYLGNGIPPCSLLTTPLDELHCLTNGHVLSETCLWWPPTTTSLGLVVPGPILKTFEKISYCCHNWLDYKEVSKLWN